MTGFWKLALGVAAAAVMTPSAQAATITYSGGDATGGATFVEAFDPAAGTLTLVALTMTYGANPFFNWSSFAGDPMIEASGTIGQSGFGQLVFSGQYQSNRYNPAIIGAQLGGTTQSLYTGDLSRFVGTGSIGFAPSLDLMSATANGVPLTRVYVTAPGSFSVRYSITYTYAAAVPEPAGWMLMLGGFALVGGALRRRRGRVPAIA